MSVNLNNMFNLLYEAEIEIDDNFLTGLFEGKLKTATTLAAGGAAVGGAVAYGKRIADATNLDTNPLIRAAQIAGGKHETASGAISSDIKNSYIGKKVAEWQSRGGLDTNPTIRAAQQAGGKTHETATGAALDELKSKATAGLSRAKEFVADNSLALGAAGAVVGAGLLYKYFTSISHYKRKLASLEAKAKSTPPEERAAIRSAIAIVKQKLNAAQAKSRTEHGNFIEKSRQMKVHINELNKAGRKQEAAKLQEKLAKRQKFLSKIGATI